MNPGIVLRADQMKEAAEREFEASKAIVDTKGAVHQQGNRGRFSWGSPLATLRPGASVFDKGVRPGSRGWWTGFISSHSPWRGHRYP
jgi:hypothetical protein